MIELDGRQYNIQTPEENAGDMIAQVNTYCQNNNVTNSLGEVIQVDANWANPLYVMFRGFAYLVSRLQQLIYSAGCSLSIPSSSERQLLNIADVAGVKRKQATLTTIVGTVYSNLASDEAVPCRITTALSYTVSTPSGTVVFHPAFDTTVAVGSSATIIMIAEIYGSFSIAGGEASFDENPEGFRRMVLEDSSPGQEQETISALRLRLQRRTEQGTMLDKAIAAVTQLNGVSLCNIYFNSSVRDTETIMNIEVPPRQALVFVQGWSNDIAKTLYQNLMCQFAGESSPDAIIQTYTSKAGQTFSVPIIPPENIPVYIRLYFNQLVDDVTKQAMADTICTLSQNRTIGQTLVSTDIVTLIKEQYGNYDLAGVTMSLDDQSYSYQVTIGSYQLIVFDTTKILIIGQE